MSSQMIRIWQETFFITLLSYFKKLQYVKCEDLIPFICPTVSRVIKKIEGEDEK